MGWKLEKKGKRIGGGGGWRRSLLSLNITSCEHSFRFLAVIIYKFFKSTELPLFNKGQVMVRVGF